MKIIKNNLISIGSILFFLALWELVSFLELINPLFISKPSAIFLAGTALIKSGFIAPHLIASMKVFFAGFILAILFGFFGGLLISLNKNIYNIFKPYIFIANALPKVAIIPLVIIWFGLGIESKIFIVFLMAFPSIIINTIDGVKNTNNEYLSMAKSFGASKFFILKSITFYSVLPAALSGVRISIGKGMIGLVVAEVFSYGVGLGYLISYYGMVFQTAKLMFIIILLLVINLMLTILVTIIEKKYFKYRI